MKLGLVVIVTLTLLLVTSVFVSANQSNKVDEFSFIRCDDELMRMFHYRDYLNNHPDANGYLIVYGGQMEKRGASKAHAARLKDLLINSLGISADRITVFVGGYREKWTVELWALSRDAEKPIPTVTLKPSDVRFRKGKIPKAEYTWSSQCS